MSERKSTKPAKPARRPSGGAQLRAAGKYPVLLGLTPSDREVLQAAALAERRPLTQFLIYHGLAAAQKILEKRLDSAP